MTMARARAPTRLWMAWASRTGSSSVVKSITWQDCWLAASAMVLATPL
jgi:hypothetical protein